MNINKVYVCIFDMIELFEKKAKYNDFLGFFFAWDGINAFVRSRITCK